MRVSSKLLIIVVCAILMLPFEPALLYANEAGDTSSSSSEDAIVSLADSSPGASSELNTANVGLTGKNWMSYVDGGLSLGRINIPGSHDSGTRFMYSSDAHAGYGLCQDTTIAEQLDNGIRSLDM